MIYFDLRFQTTMDSSTNIVAIRKVAGGQDTYAYEISPRGNHAKRHRGTVSHEGPENFTLVATVLNDYLRHHPQT